MAWNPELERLLREALEGVPWLGEKRMFGGVVFTIDGAMVCAAIAPGLMARVGKAAEAEMLALPDVRPMGSGGRRMGGWVLAGEDAWRDDVIRRRVVSAAVAHVLAPPPKTAGG
ncbi:TfoX/Sxy family protein [Camelimonas abortus]|uniref:TfoX/Sxy family protein n=1 Tax=Camelimonas abortus TaxID=1017184 RepID=A0ABV7LFV3_9HYPH